MIQLQKARVFCDLFYLFFTFYAFFVEFNVNHVKKYVQFLRYLNMSEKVVKILHKNIKKY